MSDSKDKIKEIKFEKNNLSGVIEEMKRNFNDYVEFVRISAKLKYQFYDELIKEGFTEKQALELTKRSPFDGG